jgi:tetratricopeptide (TPR) repeat protein
MQDNQRLEELKRRVQRDPASISFAALAEEYRRLGRLEEAVEACRAGLQRHPAYVSARVTLGRALMEMGDFDSAAGELEQVLRVAPENLAAIRALADIHRRRGEMPEPPHVVSDGAYGSDPEEPLVPVQHQPGQHEEISLAVDVSQPVPVEVQSPVGMAAPHPALTGLESFLSAIQRARRDVLLSAAR